MQNCQDIQAAKSSSFQAVPAQTGATVLSGLGGGELLLPRENRSRRRDPTYLGSNRGRGCWGVGTARAVATTPKHYQKPHGRCCPSSTEWAYSASHALTGCSGFACSRGERGLILTGPRDRVTGSQCQGGVRTTHLSDDLRLHPHRAAKGTESCADLSLWGKCLDLSLGVEMRSKLAWKWWAQVEDFQQEVAEPQEIGCVVPGRQKRR